MNNEINLLYNKKQKRIIALSARVRLLRFISLGLLFLACAISIVFFLLAIASPLPKLRQDEAALTQTLSSNHDKILKQTLLSIRLTDIKSIIQKRSQYGEILATLKSNLPPNTSLAFFSVEKNEISITVGAKNLDDMQIYFDRLAKLVGSGKLFRRAYLDILEAIKGESQQIIEFQAKITLSL